MTWWWSTFLICSSIFNRPSLYVLVGISLNLLVVFFVEMALMSFDVEERGHGQHLRTATCLEDLHRDSLYNRFGHLRKKISLELFSLRVKLGMLKSGILLEGAGGSLSLLLTKSSGHSWGVPNRTPLFYNSRKYLQCSEIEIGNGPWRRSPCRTRQSQAPSDTLVAWDTLRRWGCQRTWRQLPSFFGAIVSHCCFLPSLQREKYPLKQYEGQSYVQPTFRYKRLQYRSAVVQNWKQKILSSLNFFSLNLSPTNRNEETKIWLTGY